MIETERLILRRYTHEDIEAAYQMNLDPEVSRYTGDGGVHNREEIRRMITEHVMGDYETHGFGRFAVIYKPDNVYIGFSGLKFLEDYQEVDLGYRFVRKYWGKGIATESGLASIAYGFETLKLDHIIGLVYPENVASVRVLEKLGFEWEKAVVEDGKDAAKYRLDRQRDGGK